MTSMLMSPDVDALLHSVSGRVQNRSLLLDKFVPGKTDLRGDRGHSVHSSFLRNALNTAQAEAPGVRDIRKKHTRDLLRVVHNAYGQNASTLFARLEGRLAINLANGLIENAGLSLDRVLGLPFIPGSAVKGVARHAALEDLREGSAAQQRETLRTFIRVFGAAASDFNEGELKAYEGLSDNCEMKGAISFLPAYPVNEAKLVMDVTTVHYPAYYKSGDKDPSLLRKEQPLPNPFPCVEAGAEFAFILLSNGIDANPALLQAARRWLEHALTVKGIGAKTCAGYGWFSLAPELEIALKNERETEARKEKEKRDERDRHSAKLKTEADRVAKLTPEQRAGETLGTLTDEAFALFVKDLLAKPELEQKAMIELLRTSKKDKWKNWKKREKAEYTKPVLEVIQQLKLPLLP